MISLQIHFNIFFHKYSSVCSSWKNFLLVQKPFFSVQSNWKKNFKNMYYLIHICRKIGETNWWNHVMSLSIFTKQYIFYQYFEKKWEEEIIFQLISLKEIFFPKKLLYLNYLLNFSGYNQDNDMRLYKDFGSNM